MPCIQRAVVILLSAALLAFIAQAVEPTIDIASPCSEFVPLFEALPANDCFVTSLVHREADDRVFGATCGKKRIGLFSFDGNTGAVARLDLTDALWWDEPRLALGPDGSIFLGARRVEDKQFVFERLRERPEPPDAAYRRRDVAPASGEVNPDAPGMPVRRYSPEGVYQGDLALPETLARDGVGALTVCAAGKMLCGLSSPGGHFFTIALDTGEAKDYGEVVPFPEHHHIRFMSKTLMAADDGKVYLCGRYKAAEGGGKESVMGCILTFDPQTGALAALDAQVPAVTGREGVAAIDAAVKLTDGSFIGGSSDGYLFRFNPASSAIEAFGKPLRQGGVCGLALGADGLVYGAGGEPGGLPRLFAFDPASRTMRLGAPPTGNPAGEESQTFGDMGGMVCLADGTLVCAERERRGYLLLYRPANPGSAWTLTAGKDHLARCTRDRFVDIAPDGSARLAPTFLISDAMARSSHIQEQLNDETFARKIIHLPAPCREAELLFYAGGGTQEAPMLIRVNRHEIHHAQNPERMLTGGWDRETIPGAFLHQGKNEIVFGRAGTLLVDADGSGENSSKGKDWYGPWKSGALGPSDNLIGEYVVRLRVHGFPMNGTLTSPVLDLTEMNGVVDASERASVPPMVRVNRLRLSADTSCPSGTAIRFEVRSGSTPEYAPAAWGDWTPVKTAPLKPPIGRFVQWRAHLSTSSAERTPILRSVNLTAEGDATGANRDYTVIRKPPDNVIAESSYPFDYADPHRPRMQYLRDKYELSEVVKSGQTEIEKLGLLAQWVREQWEGWNDNKYNYCPQWDALEILDMAPKNLALGMCTHYATVFVQCAAALGYHARHVIVDHHCLAEVWSDQYGKWVLEDPGSIPKHVIAVRYEHNAVPLSALELHQLALEGRGNEIDIVPDPPVPEEARRKLIADLFCRFAIPLRNDYLYRPEPQELEHGFAQYHWDGYLWWTDGLDPTYPEYSLLTNRPEDFCWTLNKTRITLEDTEKVGVISVRLSGPIPNFAQFFVRFNEGEWQKAENSFEWNLKPGKNTLEAKAVNTAGLEGPVNRVEIEYAP